ncbi:polysaccharide biosynthesis protein [Brevibacillus fluminis]|uniref:Polysaccharide biosynthesis protein n=1 Tax=Brevibacillus fluminis TaxID=511487 RepID=A0A3M8DH97_9BACL|nr:nucleoside-diphosphate sugar epimerase/dehydratase [Brevibacillus fluminis]RNB87378.1 polysaccharide biosynthesis protein [Brevibacillus fluminis]
MTFRQRLLFLGTLDALIVTASVLTVYLLRFEFAVPQAEKRLLPYVIISHVILNLLGFHWMKLYHRLLQYASMAEVIAIVKAVTIAELGCFFLFRSVAAVFPDMTVPKSIYIAWALIILGVGGSRIAWRLFRDTYLLEPTGMKRRNVLIIGAGQAGVLVTKELRYAKDSTLQPVAFIDDDRKRHRLELMGLPVVGGREAIHTAVERYDIQDIVIALPSVSQAEIAKIIDICKTTTASVKILPSIADVIKGKVSIGMIRDVQVEDLLGREPVKLDLDGIAGYVSNEVVLVTGAGGSIGSELCRQLLRFSPKKLLLLGHGENSIYEIDMELRRTFHEAVLVPVIADVQDRRRLEEIFAQHRPSVIFHAAAHKHVPLMELNPAEAIKNNVLGTRNVAECAHRFGASHFVMVSTDKAVNPTSVMGVTKRLAELLVQGMGRYSTTKYVAVRFGNVLGSRGSVIPAFKKQIGHGGPVTVTHPDMIRYFMTIPEAVQLVIQAGSLANGGEIFILDMGKPVKIVQLARDLISLSGFKPEVDIKIEYTGIRPGEKLYEELLTREEGITATKHDRIFISQPIPLEWEAFMEQINMLEQYVQKPESIESRDLHDLVFHLLSSHQDQTQSERSETKAPVLL